MVTADSTTFIEGGGSAEDVASRLSQIRVELSRAVHERDVEIIQERIARLSSSLAVIKVGAPTEVALKERLRRTEGALAATQAAVSEGIVAGGGTALLRAGPALDGLELEGDYARGVQSCAACSTSRCTGSPPTPATTATRRSTRWGRCPTATGSTRSTGEFGDLFEKGVVDPVRVTRLSLEHAASVAALLLTTEALVAEELIAQPGAVVAPGFGDLAEGLARPSSPI